MIIHSYHGSITAYFLTYEGDKDSGFIAIFGSLACLQHHIIVLSISFP
ncbi:hypothetical protein PROVRETT_08259 [Providencia rettgeri DSM 1131]|nr:hypothetical protein PROVRETT_08259 [Providencia rettgeri DSM 1131]